MDNLILRADVIIHLLSIAVFAALAIYATVKRRAITRTVRHARIIYRLLLIVSGLFIFSNAVRAFCMLAPGVETTVPWLDYLADFPSLLGQAIIIIGLTTVKVVGDQKMSVQRRVLVVGAHPDDIEIACGGTVAKMRDAGYEIHGLVMTQGERGGNASVRPGEARRGGEFLGLDEIRILDLPDTRLHEHELEVLAAIEETIQSYKPSMVLTHSAHDLHQDHCTVHKATLRAARQLNMILCYESPSVTQDFKPTLFVDIGDYVDVKVESIKEHADQRLKPYVHEERVRGVAIFRGGQAKLRFAEGFEVIRAVSTIMGVA